MHLLPLHYSCYYTYVFDLPTTNYQIIWHKCDIEKCNYNSLKNNTNNQFKIIIVLIIMPLKNIKSNHAQSKATYCRLFHIQKEVHCKHYDECTYFYHSCEDGLLNLHLETGHTHFCPHLQNRQTVWCRLKPSFYCTARITGSVALYQQPKWCKVCSYATIKLYHGQENRCIKSKICSF